MRKGKRFRKTGAEEFVQLGVMNAGPGKSKNHPRWTCHLAEDLDDR